MLFVIVIEKDKNKTIAGIDQPRLLVIFDLNAVRAQRHVRIPPQSISIIFLFVCILLWKRFLEAFKHSEKLCRLGSFLLLLPLMLKLKSINKLKFILDILNLYIFNTIFCSYFDF